MAAVASEVLNEHDSNAQIRKGSYYLTIFILGDNMHKLDSYLQIGSWMFASATNVDNLYLKALNLLQMNHGQQGFLAVLKMQKAVSVPGESPYGALGKKQIC